MKKIALPFGLAAVLLLVSFGSGMTPIVSAQGPWTPQSIVDAFVAKGGKITTNPHLVQRKMQGGPQTFCEVVVTFFNVLVPTAHAGGGFGSQNAAAEIGMEEWQFLNMTNATVNNDGKDFRITMFFDKAFCGPPPSGNSPATNPVPVRSAHPSHEDPANFMNWLVAGLIALGAGFLFFPRLAGSIVRI